MMFEVIFTEIYFEEGDYYKEKKLIIAKNLAELFEMFYQFNLLSIFIYKARRIDHMTWYQEACRKAGAVISLEKKKKIDSDTAIRMIYGDDRS